MAVKLSTVWFTPHITVRYRLHETTNRLISNYKLTLYFILQCVYCNKRRPGLSLCKGKKKSNQSNFSCKPITLSCQCGLFCLSEGGRNLDSYRWSQITMHSSIKSWWILLDLTWKTVNVKNNLKKASQTPYNSDLLPIIRSCARYIASVISKHINIQQYIKLIVQLSNTWNQSPCPITAIHSIRC